MRQTNGTIAVYPISDLLRGKMFAVAIKGSDGTVEQRGPYGKLEWATRMAAGFSAKYCFPVIQVTKPTGYWLGVGVGHPKGRGQFEIVALSYIEAQSIANTAGLGDYPIQSLPFNSLPVHGTIEA